MRTCWTWLPFGLAALAGAAGCGDEGSETKSGTPPKPPQIVDIAVDANRDGVVDPDDAADQDGEDTWTAEAGASFLANLDDDDQNEVRDADDEILNGPFDEADLAPIVVSPWPDAPDGATGVFAIDPISAENVRIWKRGLDGAWTPVAGSLGPCDTPTAPCQRHSDVIFSIEEVRAGLGLAIEGRRFRVSGSWSGFVDLTYAVHDEEGAPITTDDAPDGFDRAQMRVAPWMMFGNLSAFDKAYSDSYDSNYTAQLGVPLQKGGVEYMKITDYYDQWVQDWFQTAWTAIPAADGGVHGMRVYNPRPWSQGAGLPIHWLNDHLLGPDRAVIEIYEERGSGDTYDSHGNHDLLPPYENGDDKYPHGRILLGSGVLPETAEFYEAQRIQAPAVRVKTSWLLVGHVDEVFSYVPAATPRGWKLLVGSPALARQMLEQASADGFGSTEMFVGKQWWGGQSAAITIDQVLGDPDLMQESQQAQAEIDGMLDVVRTAVGLADDEIVEIPFLFEQEEGYLVAYIPGTVNLLAFGDYTVHADPFGPVINGADIFKKDLEDRLGTPANQLGSTGQGLFVHFADDWDLYHVLLGEVHCSSNIEGPPPNERWWEVGR